MNRMIIGSAVAAGGLFLMMETSAFAQTGPCSDIWLNKAVAEVARRAPKGSGTSGECDPRHYSPNGQWSSYRDVLNKVAVKLTNKGAAYVFIAPTMAVLQGHIGWAYANNDGTYEYGATDAPGGRLAIPKGVDTNTPWRGKVETEAELFKLFREHYAYGTGYSHVKHTFVANRSQGGADQMAAAIRNVGYGLVGNNCLDHTYAVLKAYGVQEGRVMQWKQTHAAPNGWFLSFGRMELDGRLSALWSSSDGEAI